MGDSDARRRCSQCGEWATPVFDTKVDTERVEFAESNVVPDPREMVSQHIIQVAKTGLCRKCMVKELETMKEKPDNAAVRVNWPSNGSLNT